MSDELCPVHLVGVAEDRFGYDFVLLEDEQGRQLPIWVDRCQAVSVFFKWKDTAFPRPMTHDLLCNSVERLGGSITRVLIDDLWQDVYYAKVCLRRGDEGEEMQVDCRPSDAVSIALRAEVPILVRDDVLEEGQVPQPLPPDPSDQDRPFDDTT